MPKAFSEAEREFIRAKLISVGKRLVGKIGIRFLVVDDVAREAGISKGSFYSFFPSREDFILSVFEAWEAQYRSALIKEIDECEGSAREKLERFFLGAFNLLESEPGLALLGMKDIQVLLERLPPERIAAHQAQDNKVLGETFGRWIEAGLFPARLLPAIRGLVPALFSIAIHKEDFPEGSYKETVKIISEALAMRIAQGEGSKGGGR